MSETKKVGMFFRELPLPKPPSIAEDEKLASSLRAVVSTEEPSLEFIGGRAMMLSLDHSPSAIRLDRFRQRGKVLIQHNPRELVGKISDVNVIQDTSGSIPGNGYMESSLDHSDSDAAKEIVREVNGGYRTDVSLGFRVYRIEATEQKINKIPLVIARDWQPLEVSHVAVGEDPGAHILRGSDGSENDLEIIGLSGVTEMNEETKAGVVVDVAPDDGDQKRAMQLEINEAREKAKKEEIERQRSIQAIASAHNAVDMGREYIERGHSLDKFRADLLHRMATDPSEPSVQFVAEDPNPAGLSPRDEERYDIMNVIRMLSFNTPKYVEAAAYEIEVGQAVARAMGANCEGIPVPMNFITSCSPVDVTRTGQAGTATKGAEFIQTSVLSSRFIDLLRNRMVTSQFNPTSLTGLRDNVNLPKQTGPGTAYWVAEGAATTKSGLTTGDVQLRPKNLTAEFHWSKQLITQSTVDVNRLYERDMVAVLALEWDRASLYGSGTAGQPTGVANTSGINTGTAYPLANDGPDYAGFIEMETLVASNNADMGQLGYVMHSAGRGHCKSTVKHTNGDREIWEMGDTVNGYPVGVSNQVNPQTDYWFANWGDLILAQWGVLDLTADPYTRASNQEVRLIGLIMVDVGVRHPESFTYTQRSLT